MAGISMKLSDFDYELPREAIASAPARPRDAARLLDLGGGDDAMADRFVRDLPKILKKGDLLVVNDTRVIPARLIGRRGEAGISLTLHRHMGGARWRAFAKPARKCREGDIILIGEGFAARVVERGHEGEILVAFVDAAIADSSGEGAGEQGETMEELGEAAVNDGLQRHGIMPLPPYIERPKQGSLADRDDYQTMFASRPGAVAAPTAGLHFTPQLMRAIEAAGVGVARVTLHVGAGTFLPVKCEDIAEHRMHAEWGHIPASSADAINAARQAGGRVVAVGTTSLRILEACHLALGRVDEFTDETDIFITPGFRFGVVDLLLTNFHLPRSTLLMLVSAFAGMEPIRAAYAHALASGYRFFSYGDACLLANARPGGE